MREHILCEWPLGEQYVRDNAQSSGHYRKINPGRVIKCKANRN